MDFLDLPVYRHRDLILAALEKNQAVVVESPTGSGKTTQLPVILHEAGYSHGGIIGVTQPRRIAAVSVSEFIARQMKARIPGVIGYKMRFEDRTSADTKIKIMTDGILLQEMKLDPWLSKYSLIVVDEAHERSLNIDFILGLLKRVLESRRDFKVIISSATINAQIFSEYFGECPVVKIETQRFPVTLIYDPPELWKNSGQRNSGGAANGGKPDAAIQPDILLEKIETIVSRFVEEKHGGDILVFLSGEKMIKECMQRLAFSPVGKALRILPLYGRLGREEQERVFEKTPRGKTKVVISTNIAETSVTIDGITAVIDSGLSKLNWYNPRTFTSSLVETPISKASANQRKGRAGRTSEGTTYRLYTRRDFENRALFTTEEIFRTDLSEVVLRMADLGLSNFEDFDFISMPSKDGLVAAVETLNLLEALEPDRSLSSTGKLMTEFPLAPRHSRIIVEAVMRYPEVLRETLIAAAFLSTQSPYILPPGEETDARRAHHSFRDDSGDFVSYLKLFKAYGDAKNKSKFCDKNYLDERAMTEIVNVVYQLEETLASLKIPVPRSEWPLSAEKISDYLCCIGRGMIQFVCVREGKGRNVSYRSLTADRIIIHPGSVMFRMDPRYIVAGEIVKTTRMYAMSVSPLSPGTLDRISPGLFTPDFFRAEKTAPGETGETGETGERRIKPANGRAGRETKGERRLKRLRDFTHNIKISGEVFEITTIKGKKTAILPWEKLSAIRNTLPGETGYKGLKGVIIIDGQYSLLAGEKLNLILGLVPSLDIENALTRKLPGKKSYNAHTDLPALVEHLNSLVTPGKYKKGSKELGFLTLLNNQDGYRFRSSRGFHTSLNESLASLETLIDELDGTADHEAKKAVNNCYRRLSNMVSGCQAEPDSSGVLP